MNSVLKYLAFFIAAPVFGQFFNKEDFHSDLERKAFELLLAKKPIDPFLFFITSNEKNTLVDYQNFAIDMKALPMELHNEKFEKLNENKKLKKIFRKTQKEFFNSYSLYQNYDQLINEGVFNCITGTAFYALLFKEMGYDYRIYETPFHTFLEIDNSDNQKILIESTDPAFGFIDDPDRIELRKKDYAYNGDINGFQNYGSDKLEDVEFFMNEITMQQLAGLQYYNLAVVKFNEGNYDSASKMLKKASYLYPSSRIILLQVLSERLVVSYD